jgi:alkaline phosphatase
MIHRPFRNARLAATVALAVGFAGAGTAFGTDDDDRDLPGARSFTPGNVIFFHPDGTAANHWGIARMYYKGLDGSLNWDRLRHMAFYRGHMGNVINGTSNGAATTHAFGYKVDGLGSFGKDGDGDLTVPTDKFIFGLSGFDGSIMREAANAGIPVGVVNDGHIGEPGTGVFLAEVGNRNDWQEITRQMIQGRPGKRDVDPWVILGGGEADTLPKGAKLLHRNVNQERGAELNADVSLREDNLNLQAEWNARGRGDLSNDPLRFDDYVVVRTRAEFERLRQALATNARYAPHVLGLFAYQDLFNDRNEQDLINRGFVRPSVAANTVLPGKVSRLVLRGDFESTRPGFNPPTFAEMTDVAITVLDRAARQQQRPEARRFLLVGEPESNDNFGNNDNAIGLLESMRDTDDAFGVALDFLKVRPRTLILTAADSDAGGMQVISPNISGNPPGTPQTNVLPAGRSPDVAGTVGVNPSAAPPAGVTVPAGTAVNSFVDGVEGRQSPLFVTEPDQFGQRMQFGVVWPGTGDYSGGILSRAAGLNARLLNTTFSERFDNVDVYRMMHLTLFGRLLPYPQGQRAPVRSQ